MAFPRQAARQPTAIGDVVVTLTDPDPLGEGAPNASYVVQVRHSDGTLRLVSGDLSPHLSAAQISGLLSFMAAMRTKAIAEILP